jgi:HK97 family phage portal protein
MNPISTIRSWFTREKGLSGSTAAWLRGDDVSSQANSLNLASAQEQSVWIYSCVSVLGENVANVPFRFSTGTRKGEDILEEGPAVDLFNQPHPMLSRFEFWELLIQWLMLRGRCFIIGLTKAGEVVSWGERFGQQVPVELCFLNPDQMRCESLGGSTIWIYTSRYGDQMSSRAFLPEEVVYLRLPGISNFYDGHNPLFVAALAAQTDYHSAQFMKGLMANNADQGMVVGTEQKLGDEQRVQIEAALRNRKRMAGRADKPLILEGGLKVEKPTVSAADMQFLENRKFNRQEICAVYRVPQEVLGFTEDANRSVSDAARLNFIENRILPLCERIEASIDRIVKSFGEDLWGWFDAETLPVMQATRRARYTTAIPAFNIGIPLNTLNQVFDLGLPGDLPHGDKVFLPFSVQEFGAPPEEPAIPPPDSTSENAENAENAEKPEEGTAEAETEKGLALLKAATRTPQPALHTCGADTAYARSIAGSIRLKQGRLRKFFFEQRNRVLEKLAQLMERVAHYAAEEERVFSDVFNLLDEHKILWQRLGRLLAKDLEFGVAQIGQDLGLDDFKVPPSDAIAFMNGRENMVQEINRTTFNRLMAGLQEGLADGESYEQMAERVKATFKDASDSRAHSIAVTETNIAINSGRFAAMEAAGVERKGWATSSLDGVRPAHQVAGERYADGIPLDEPFEVGGELLDYPGDPKGSPGNVINCRCFTFAVLDQKSAFRIPHSAFLAYESWAAKTIQDAPGQLPTPHTP